MKRVAVLGLGHMGAPMARRLIGPDLEVVVWNRTSDRGAGLAEAGARVAPTPAAAVDGADAIITMLTDAAAVEAVLFGPDGAAPALAGSATVVDMSTIGPDAVARIAGRLPAGVALVDAPVAGSTDAAAAGSLRIFAGGAPEALARVRPVLDRLGTVTECGASGTGAALKLVLNTALVTALASLTEVLAVAEAVGVPRGTALETLKTGPLGIAVTRATGHGGHFAVALAAKDLDLALAAVGRPLPVAAAAGTHLRDAMAAGRGDADLTTIVAGP
jgi:3-hydroxyisobutyrate dehydrogenase-like beta-hydroxyacid dehydrogenase